MLDVLILHVTCLFNFGSSFVGDHFLFYVRVATETAL